MAAAHSYSLLKAFFRYLSLLFCTAHIFLDISSTLAAEFSLESTPRDSPERPLNHSILPSLHHSVDTAAPQILPRITVLTIEGMCVAMINIGTLKFEVKALLSTGSNFNWFLCVPCNPCFPHINDIFNPDDSQSYSKVSCRNNKYCMMHNCDGQNKCKFDNTYNFGAIGGIVSSDELRFDEGENPSLNVFVFGCVNRAHGRFPKHVEGLIGLGRGVHSVVSQLGVNIFSVCLPDGESEGYVKFGSAVEPLEPNAVTTHLVQPSSNLYYVRIKELTVGQQNPIKISKQRNAFLVDTGTPMSLVDGETMRGLINSFRSAVRHPSLKSMVDPEPGYEFCYHVEGHPPNIPVFPYMKVEFRYGGSIYLPGNNLFRRVQYNKWCLSIKSSGDKSLFGGDAMANRNIVFSLSHNRISYDAHGKC